MELFRKILLLSVILICISLGNLFSQSGYSTSNWYAYKGKSITEYNYQTEWNRWCECYTKVKYCRQLTWYQEWHAGYVYYWRRDPYYGNYQWVSEWKEGSFWYCTWSGWYKC